MGSLVTRQSATSRLIVAVFVFVVDAVFMENILHMFSYFFRLLLSLAVAHERTTKLARMQPPDVAYTIRA